MTKSEAVSWYRIQEMFRFQSFHMYGIIGSALAIGVVIVAGGTSLPELASSINAVLNDFSDLALGAVVGSNIANLILVMATTTLIFPIVNINKNQINFKEINTFEGDLEDVFRKVVNNDK